MADVRSGPMVSVPSGLVAMSTYVLEFPIAHDTALMVLSIALTSACGLVWLAATAASEPRTSPRPPRGRPVPRTLPPARVAASRSNFRQAA
jgi:hypothetical protein